MIGNVIHHWARWQRVPQYAALTWTGVGHRVSGNTFRDAPTPAVQSGGNVDCVFEGNLVENVAFEQIDMGAYYHGSSAGGYQFADFPRLGGLLIVVVGVAVAGLIYIFGRVSPEWALLPDDPVQCG